MVSYKELKDSINPKKGMGKKHKSKKHHKKGPNVAEGKACRAVFVADRRLLRHFLRILHAIKTLCYNLLNSKTFDFR